MVAHQTIIEITDLAVPTDEYPLQFFCRERYSLQELYRTVWEAYIDGDFPEDRIPSLSCFWDHLFFVFIGELGHRALLYDDVVWYGSSVKASILDAIEDGESENVEAYMWAMHEDGIPFGSDGYWGKLFAEDIEYLLRTSGMSFVDVDPDYESIYSEMEGTPGTPIDYTKVILYNNPIVGVW